MPSALIGKGKRIKPTLDSRLAELWDEEKNGAVELVRLKQRDRYWWKCPICGCEWSRELGTALKSNLCPACDGRVLVKGYNDLATTHPELAAEWDYDRNGELRPSDVLAGARGQSGGSVQSVTGYGNVRS